MADLTDRATRARQGNLDDRFRTEVLILLERIAVALENPPQQVNFLGDPIDPVGREAMKKPLTQIQATHCTCGNDYSRICTQCTPARLAEAYRRHDQ